MPVSIVVGGQYGSEGKGKVALALVRESSSIAAVVRPGGTNSGHTAYDKSGNRVIFRQFPAAALDCNVCVIFPAGSYIDPVLFHAERQCLGLRDDQILVDRRAHIILPEHREVESAGGLVATIGSTGSGTGSSVMSRIARFGRGAPPAMPVEEHLTLAKYIREVPQYIDDMLRANRRILIEGTQGYGLSLLHGDSWPRATSRDTTAAAFLSEAGISPMAVDDIVLVLRSFPIRVAGDSGPLVGETTWEALSRASGRSAIAREFTSVTNNLRRVGRFDPEIVKAAIRANGATRIVLNHLDYVDYSVYERQDLSLRAEAFVAKVEQSIGRSIDFVGTGPKTLVSARNEEPALR